MVQPQHYGTQPAPSGHEQFGLYPVQNHNTGDQRPLSATNSPYGSPGSQTVRYAPSHFSDYGGDAQFMLGHQDSHEYPPPEYFHLGMGHAQGRSATATPHSESSNLSARKTRSGRVISPRTSPAKELPETKASSRRKAKANKSDKLKTPKLSAPLSVLTKDMTEVPIRDMAAWVNRSIETRRKEAEKRNGYITRPMNSFMMYRSAYAERTKAWCLQNNHQVVSSVSGESWPMEPQEIRDLYNEYARIERINHQRAHPEYKFSPSKPGAPNKKRKADPSEDEEEDDEPSELDDPDGEWAPSSKRRPKSQNRNLEQSPIPYPDDASTAGGLGVDPWMSPAIKPVPMQMGALYGNPYYGNGMGVYQHNSSLSSFDEMPFRRAFELDQSLSGIPGGSHHTLLHGPQASAGPLQYEAQVDPTILNYSGHGYADMHDPALSHNSPLAHNAQHGLQSQVLMDSRLGDEPVSPRYRGDFLTDEWPHPELTLQGHGDPDSEFDKWNDGF